MSEHGAHCIDARAASPRWFNSFERRVVASLGLGALLLLAGCAAGPNYQAPAITLDPSFVNAGATTSNSATPGSEIARFWRDFNDPMLSQLIERSIAVNGDVRIARARLQEARAQLQGAQAELLPEVDVRAGVSHGLQPQYLIPGTVRSERTSTIYDAGFLANWELDFFGRNQRAAESAAAELDASQAGVRAALTSVAAEVARNYLELRGLQERQQVAQDSIVNQRDSLRLTEARLDSGRGTRFDVARARTLLNTTEASLPALQAAIDRTAYRLATLTAQPPRQLAAWVAQSPGTLPSLPVTDLGALPIGTPEQLLGRRPDLVQAERQLAAATANIGVATADLFPRVNLVGLLGLAGVHLGSLGNGSSQQYSLGAALTWPLLDFGRVRSRIGASEARAQAALANYEQTVRVALEETEGALTTFTRNAQQSESLSSAAASAEDASSLARMRFDAGSVDFLVVLDAQRQVLAARDQLVQAQVGQATALVGIYRALGGGWSEADVRAGP